jgi:cell division protein FtsI (penicillin-binding protein 3)
MLGRTDSRIRLLILLVAFIVAATALVARLAWWQIGQRDRLSDQARLQTSLRSEEPSRRGAIYDRSGTVVLATTIDRYRLSASPDQLSKDDQAKVATELVTVLGLEGDPAAELTAKMTSGRPYVVLARDLDEEVASRIRTGLTAGRLAAVGLEDEPARVYPQQGGGPDSTLAAQILGFVNREGVGQYGVEQRYQELLAGTPRTLVAQRDANSRPIPDTARIIEPGLPGADLRLTIDAGLQLAVEQELLAAWVADRAVSVSAVVIDPHTGEVYASASYPSYNANDYRAIAASAPGRFIDPVVSAVYEPGSVFKMLTAVAGLETGVVTPTTPINDTGTLRLDGGRTKIDDADRKAKGWMTFEDIVAWSRNVGAAKVALKLGSDTASASAVLHDTWRRLGFGSLTGIDVSGEVAGLVRDPAISAWRQIDLANGSFGQGIAVTPIQLAVAFSAMVNGGRLVQPHVVQAIGDQEIAPAPRAEGVVSAGGSAALTAMMGHVVSSVPFYSDRTLVPGYTVGGKTGTAQIWDPAGNGGKGGWKVNLFNYSFVGYIGRGVPELIIAVRIHEGTPTVARVGQLEMPVMSFELFRRIATDAMTTLDLPMPAEQAAPTDANGEVTGASVGEPTEDPESIDQAAAGGSPTPDP